MKLPKRLEQAVLKLYTAFHNNKLQPGCCKQCAVGNILNQTDQWKHLVVAHGDLRLSYVGLVNEKFNKKFFGYSPSELLQIEYIFLSSCQFELPITRISFKPSNQTQKDRLFKALCNVIDYLCALDNITSITAIKELFEYDIQTNKAKKELHLNF